MNADWLIESFLRGRKVEAILQENHFDSKVLHSTIHIYQDHGDHHGHEHDEGEHEVDEDAHDPLAGSVKTKKPRAKAQSKTAIGPFGMSYNQAIDAIGGSLSKPSKMPGYSIGIPAVHCKIGAILHKVKGSTCHGCYALKGMYAFPDVKAAQAKRFDALSHPQWPEAMATVIQKHANQGHVHFRWHDSGDLQSVDHLAKIAKVAEMTPHVQHWLPTREYAMVSQFRASNKIPKNLTIRLSGHHVDKAPPHSHGLPVSSVTKMDMDTFQKHSGKNRKGKAFAKHFPEGSLQHDVRTTPAFLCKAPSQGGECANCRACWDPKTGHVVYHKH